MSSIAAKNRSRNQTLAMSSLQAHPFQGSTLMAIRQEGVRLTTADGLVDAQLIKVLRIDQEPLPHRQHLGHRLRPTRLLATQLMPSVKPRLRLVQPQLVPDTVQPQWIPKTVQSQSIPETERSFDSKRIRLRSIGEVLTDQAGHFYEMRGEQLHTLGELVRDELGRIFEICHPTNEVEVDTQLNDPKIVAADSTVKPANKRSILTRLTDCIRGLFNKGHNQNNNPGGRPAPQ